MIKFITPLLFVTSIFLCSCGGDQKDECVKQPDVTEKVTVKIEHLEDTVANISTKAELVTFFRKNPHMRDFMFGRNNYPDDSTFLNQQFKKISHPGFDTLLLETKRIFKDASEVENQFSEAFTNIKFYYPDFTPPKVQTVITGIETDLFVSDSLIIVGLDHYLGEEGKFRPRLYDYLLRRYDPEDIVPSCMLIYGIGPQLNKTNLDDKTILADMIAYGKSFYFAKHMLPCTPDSVFLWYRAEEMAGARANEDMIWARLIQDKILFSTNVIDKRNYLGERPFTIQVGEKCPGRIAQWVGWQIVKSYMKENRDVTLPQLMEMDDAQKLFKESGYKPKQR